MRRYILKVLFYVYSSNQAYAGPKAHTSCSKRDDEAVIFDAGKIE